MQPENDGQADGHFFNIPVDTESTLGYRGGAWLAASDFPETAASLTGRNW